MKNGFTLVEIQAVLILMAIIIVISIPSVVEQLRKSELQTQTMIETTAFDAARSYMVSKPQTYKLTPGNKHCIEIQELFEAGLITEKIFNNKVGNQYDLNGYITILIENDKSYTYEFSTVCIN